MRKPDRIAVLIQSRKLARALGIPARDVRRAWKAAARRFRTPAGVRAELTRLRMQEAPWPRCLCA